MRVIKWGIITILFLAVSFAIFTQSFFLFRVEYEITSKPSAIRDGDTFEIPGNPIILLGDIDCPESYEPGGPDAIFALTQLIDDKKLYIDVDNKHPYNTSSSSFECVVYVDHNSTHLLNVNKALLVLKQASINDLDNQWDPYRWSLYVPKPSNKTIMLYFTGSAGLSLFILIGLYILLVKVKNRFQGHF